MNKLKRKIQEIIFEADTPMGKFFDLALLVMILLSVIVVMLESVESYRKEWYWLFEILEWIFTILFSLEYLLRIFSVKNPLKYIEHSKLTDGEGFNIDLVNNLLKVKNTFDKTPQALLNNGQQSAGNFLLSDEPSVLRIKNIIMNRVKRYRDSYMDSDEGFIKNWPQNINLYDILYIINQLK